MPWVPCILLLSPCPASALELLPAFSAVLHSLSFAAVFKPRQLIHSLPIIVSPTVVDTLQNSKKKKKLYSEFFLVYPLPLLTSCLFVNPCGFSMKLIPIPLHFICIPEPRAVLVLKKNLLDSQLNNVILCPAVPYHSINPDCADTVAAEATRALSQMFVSHFDPDYF